MTSNSGKRNNLKQSGWESNHEIPCTSSCRPPSTLTTPDNVQLALKTTPTYNERAVEQNLGKYPLLPPCSCRKLCSNLIHEESRELIHRSFWNMDYFSRGLWIFNRIKTMPVSSSKKAPKSGINRSCVRGYFLESSLKVDDPLIVNVCQKFFLSTLGYKSDKIITYTLKVFKDFDGSKKLVSKVDCKLTDKVDGKLTDSKAIKPSMINVNHHHSLFRPCACKRGMVNHPLIPPCACKRDCANKIGEVRRRMIHAQYWNTEYSQRKEWLYSCVQSSPPKRRSKDRCSSRTCSRQYFLKNGSGEQVGVCQKFFLSTLGYTSDKIIVHTMATMSSTHRIPLASSGRRSKNKISFKVQELLRKHITENASEFKKRSVRQLHDDFLANHPDLKTSYESYRNAADLLNVREDCRKRKACNSGRARAEKKAKVEEDDESYFFEDFDQDLSSLLYPSYLEELNSNLPLNIPSIISLPEQASISPDSNQSQRQTNRQTHHQFVVMPGSDQLIGHLVTNDNLVML